MNSYQKKEIKKAQIKLGKTNKRQRAAFWQYILKNDLGVGFYDAQQLARKGFQVLKNTYREDQPD